MAPTNPNCAGEPSTWALIPNTCTVVLTNGEGTSIPIDFGFLLDKVIIPDQLSTFSYDEVTHTVTHNGIPYALNCGELVFNQTTCVLSYTNEKGKKVDYQLPVGVRSISGIDANFNLTYLDDKGDIKAVSLAALRSDFAYNANTHTVVHNGDVYQLNCGDLEFDPVTCVMRYTDEKGVVRNWTIPAANFSFDSVQCLLTIIPAKGGAPLTIPTGVPSSQVSLQLVGDQLTFTYKDSVCSLTLPRGVTEIAWDKCSRLMSFKFSTGHKEIHDLGDSCLEVDHECGTALFTSAGGKAALLDICKAAERCKPVVTLVQADDGTITVTHFDGYSKTETFSITPHPVQMADGDNAELNDGVLQLMLDNGTLTVDICAIIAQLCNARFTQISDTQLTFVDNAGNAQRIPIPFALDSVCMLNAQGVPVAASLVGRKATLPYTPICMKVATEDGDFLDVTFDPATGCYTMPFTPTTIPQDQFGSVSLSDDGQFFNFTYPDGSSASLCSIPNKGLSVNGADPLVPNADGFLNLTIQCQDWEGNYFAAPVNAAGVVQIPHKGRQWVTYEDSEPEDTDALIRIDEDAGCLFIKSGNSWVQPQFCIN